jgi:predicted DNA-binding protein
MAEQTQKGPMVRAQLLLTPALRQRLERVAEREGRSLSDLARRALEAGLDALEDTGEARIQQKLALLQELAEIRRRDRERNGVYEGDLIAEVRAERERQMERVWRGE